MLSVSFRIDFRIVLFVFESLDMWDPQYVAVCSCVWFTT